jgi:ABC-2 type transport system ATP-binding protein
MRQRLGIAQAMLGLPELLILDEPTNGLDPPQIAAMRPILREYARGGRTVLISSHLLAEVELTCTHVVVMHAGRVITSGSVAELLASDDTTQLELGPVEDGRPGIAKVAAALRGRDGVAEVRELDDRTIVVHATVPRDQVVAAAVAAGAAIESVSAHRHLEEVFLGVIADTTAVTAHGSGGSGGLDGADPPEGSLVDRLRKVRPR